MLSGVPSVRDAAGSPGPTSSNEQTWATLLWVLDVVLTVIAPLVVGHLWRKQSRFVDHHGKACLNHTASVLVLMLAACVVFGGAGWVALMLDFDWSAIAFGSLVVLVVLGLGLFTFVVHVIAAVKALRGEWYTPPLCWRFLR